MHHDIRVDGQAFALRPVELDDAAYIVGVRSDPEHTRWLHPVPSDVGLQEAWLEAYFRRPGDYYFVVERISTRAPEGLISIYDIDPVACHGTWGRWLLRRGSLAATESALLVYRVAFDVLGLESVSALSVLMNQPVVSFHESCGLPRYEVFPQYFHIRGVAYDAVEHRLTRLQWPEVEPLLAGKASRVARTLRRERRGEELRP